MPKETIRKLADDIGRVLAAGAHLAAADPELAADRAKLESLARQLGDKAPVLGQLAQLTAKALGAPGPDAARELVSLATSVAQVRAAQAGLAASASTEPLVPVPEIATPCNARDLYDLRDALIQSGSGRAEVVNGAIERRDIADLRLVDAVVQAMGDSYLGEKVTTDAVPLLGRAVVAPIRAKLRINGGAVDGRRLRALVAIEKEGARELLMSAVKEGSPAMREAALDAICDYARGMSEFEPVVLDLFARERAGGVKKAAVRALAGYSSDAALDALIGALAMESTRGAAAEALGASKHPKAVDRLLAALDQALAGPKGKKKDDKEARAKSVGSVLAALSPHPDARIPSRALELVDEFGAPAANAVVTSGDAKQLSRVADLLAGDNSQVFPIAVSAAVKLGADEAFKRMSPAFKAKDRNGQVGKLRLTYVTAAIAEDADKRWVDFLIKIVADEPGVISQSAIDALGRIRDRRAVKPLVKLLEAEKSHLLRASAIRSLGRIGDPSALEAIFQAAGSGGQYQLNWAAHEAVMAIDDPSSVEKVRAIVAGLKDGTYHWSRHLLHALERKYPGR